MSPLHWTVFFYINIGLAFRLAGRTRKAVAYAYRVVQKTDTQFYFWDNFGNSAPILTIFSLSQAEIYGA